MQSAIRACTVESPEKPYSRPKEFLWEADRYAASEFEDGFVEFRLTYQGPLPSSSRANPRAVFKHRLRRHFHKQLEKLWNVQQPLSGILRQHFVREDSSSGTLVREEWTGLDALANQYKSEQGIRWAPLINAHYGLVCELDVLLLRPADPGNITTHGGDVDNRIKTLLDALTIPQEIPAQLVSTETYNPFFCLMESDALVTQLKITVDRLLMPLNELSKWRCSECGVEAPEAAKGNQSEENESFPTDSDVYALVLVHPLIADPRKAYIEFSL